MIYRFDDFEVDLNSFELRRGGSIHPAEPLVFDLICFLVRNPGRVVSRDEIIEHVWNGRFVSDATVSSCVKSARKALGDSGESQNYIRTVRGRGFQFLGRPEEVNDTTELPETATEREPAPQPSASPARSDAPEKPVIAVMPFQNLSASADDYFSDGLTEDIITNLSRFRDVLVIGRTSTFQFKGQATDLDELRTKLKAGYLVEGSVRRAAGRVRITVQLVDATTGFHLWADSYDREMEDIFAVQDEVTRTIAASLGVKIQDVATQRALMKHAIDLDAYDCVLRARRYTSMLSAEMHAEARDLLEQAIKQDPGYADAHALLANVYLAEHRFDTNPRPDPIGRALAMAQKAVELDPQNAYARCWLGIVHYFRRENDKFEAEAERALALNPNDPETLADIGHYFAFMGKYERGLALSDRARELNPLHPGWYYFGSARHKYHLHAYEEMLAIVERIGMPEFYWTHLLNTAALGQIGRPEAASSLREIFRVKPDFSARAELEKWNVAPDDVEHLIEGLRKAGLDD